MIWRYFKDLIKKLVFEDDQPIGHSFFPLEEEVEQFPEPEFWTTKEVWSFILSRIEHLPTKVLLVGNARLISIHKNVMEVEFSKEVYKTTFERGLKICHLRNAAYELYGKEFDFVFTVRDWKQIQLPFSSGR